MWHIQLRDVPMWWLIYRRDDNIVGIAIVEAPSLYHARMRAAVAGIGKAAEFSESLEINAAHVRAIPQELIGKLLSPQQAAELKGRLLDGGPIGESPPVTPLQEIAVSIETELEPSGEVRAAITSDAT
jgi:hypothetical protein